MLNNSTYQYNHSPHLGLDMLAPTIPHQPLIHDQLPFVEEKQENLSS